jgi:hypothetical protein
MPNVANTPRGFHTHSKAFFAAAEIVYQADPHLVFPLAFLWGRTIELLLKSYLLSVGVTIDRLRSKSYGHNLIALHKEAMKRGISPLIGAHSEIAGLLTILNPEYQHKRLEYRENGTSYSIPNAELARLIINRLIRGVDFHLEQKGI